MEAKRRLGDYDYYRCDACRQTAPYEQRRHRRCGWVPRADWVGKLPAFCVGISRELEVCPGYAQYDARAQEVFRAWSWWDKGQLAVKFREPSEMLMQLVEVANAAINGANQWYMDESMSKAKRNA